MSALKEQSDSPGNMLIPILARELDEKIEPNLMSVR